MSKPAFPRPFSGKEVTSPSQDGMSLLEFYAGQALVGMLNHGDAYKNPDKAAVWAFEQAEVMVKEAEKRSKS